MSITDIAKRRHGTRFFGTTLSKFELDPTDIGAEHVLRQSPWAALIGGLFMAGFMSFPAIMMLGDRGREGQAHDPVQFLLIPPLVILAITTLVCLWRWYNQSEIKVTSDGFVLTRYGLTNSHEQQLAHGDFVGVLMREHVIKRKNSSTTYQVIELLYEEPKLTIPLLVRRGRSSPRQAWEDLASAFDLPALQRSGSTVTQRGAESLDKTIQEKIADGEVASDYDHQTVTPEAFRVEGHEEDGEKRLRVHVLKPRMSRFVLPFVALLSATPLIAVINDPGMDNAWVAVAVFFVFTGIIFLTQRQDKNTPRYLDISPSRLIYHDPIGKNYGIQIDRETLSFEAIEEIRVEKKQISHRVLAAGDAGTMTIADGVDEEAATWLKDFILAAIAKANR